MSFESSSYRGIVPRFVGFALHAILLFGLCQNAVAQGDGRSGPKFPRIATISYGDGVGLTNPERIQIMGKTDVALLGMWPGWGPFDGMSMADVVDQLRAINPEILVGPYTNVTESNESKAEVFNKVSSETGPGGKRDWWLRNSAGNHTNHWPGNFSVNHSKFVVPDSNGDRFPEWLAKFNYDNLLSKARFNAVFCDVMTPDAIETADWNGDGVNDDGDSAIAVEAVSEGHVTYVREMAELQPGIVRICNLTEAFHPKRILPDIYKGLLEGGFLEGAIGQPWAIEKWNGWQEMMTQYRRLMDALREPKIGILNTHVRQTDYKLMRYGLTSTLMDNGYFAADPDGLGDYTWQFWYDEFDVELGYAVDNPQTNAWSKGVYKREFQNGLALVNPRGNGTQTVNVGAGWKRFSGSQAPSHNSGQPVESISLADADGIILLRVNGPIELGTIPLPPTLQ